MRVRVGKIARLPENIREELNRRLLDGARGRDMPAWRKALPGEICRLQKTHAHHRVVQLQFEKVNCTKSDLLGPPRSYDQ